MAAEDIIVERDFGLMLSDFTRIFPRVWPQFEQLDESCVRVPLVPSGSVEVTLSKQKFRKLGALQIPYLDIHFRFEATSEGQRAEFFEDFERSFQKGGG